MSAPVCDEDPEHGPMQEQPMYGHNREILQYGYFCQVEGCNGYGGPAKTQSKKQEPKPKATEQLTFFEETMI